MILKKNLFKSVFNPLFSELFEIVDDRKSTKISNFDFKEVFAKIYNEFAIDINLCISQEEEYEDVLKKNITNQQVKPIIDKIIEHVEVNVERLFVKPNNGKIFSINVLSTDTIEEVKRKIEDKKGIPFDEQCLVFSGKTLEDDKKLASYGIIKESILFLMLIMENKFKISIATENKAIIVEVDQNMTTENLKRKIQDEVAVKFYKQQLIFADKELDDNQKLRYYNIQSKSKLFLITKSVIEINVKSWNGAQIKLYVNYTDKVSEVKAKIFEKNSIPEDKQRLIYKGKLLDDNMELNKYSINDESVINLAIRLKDGIQIYIQTWNGKIVTIEANNSDLITDVKTKVQKKAGILSEQQILIFKNTVLENNCKLSDYNIKKESTIQLYVKFQGEKVKIAESDLFDPVFNYDFTYKMDLGKIYIRGGELYSRPYGWMRIALKVKGKYESDEWLGSTNQAGEWPVAYHGTNQNGLEGFSFDGFDLNKIKNLNNGKGHIVTPFINEAIEYASKFVIDNQTIIYVIQSRVNPAKIIRRKDEKFWILPSNEDLRPYGICCKTIGAKETVSNF